MFNGSQLYLRKEQHLKRKSPEEQQPADLPGHQTDAIFVFNLKNCVYFRGNVGCAKFWDPTIIIIKKQ